MALRAVTIGYGYKPIAEAAIKQIWNGNGLTRLSLIELKEAETLRDLIPWVDMVKFAKNGSNVTTAAIKLSRAYTGKNMLPDVCSIHFSHLMIGLSVTPQWIKVFPKKENH